MHKPPISVLFWYNYEKRDPLKSLLFFLLLLTGLHALPLTVTTFSSDFEQTIIDDQNKTLRYHGNFIAKAPAMALWDYREPIVKQVLINGNSVTMVEPDLEQVIYKRIEKDFDFFGILEKALLIEKGHYEASYEYRRFSLYLDGNVIKKIVYLDDFDNVVTIRFTNTVQNAPIDEKRFSVTVPDFYDVIRE